jgi:S-layer homology domain
MRQLTNAFLILTLIQLFPVLLTNAAKAEESTPQLQPPTPQSHQQVSTQVSDSVSKVVAAKLMTNFADGNFYPEKLITRGELASILVKTFQLDKRQAASKGANITPPDDVSSFHPAFNDIQTVLKTRIMKGYRNNLFFPNQKINRAEALAIFAQAYGVFQFADETVNEILAPHPDAAAIPEWARKAIATIVTEGFVNTDTQGNLSPLEPMTRGDMAFILSKFLQREQRLPETPVVPDIPNASK